MCIKYVSMDRSGTCQFGILGVHMTHPFSYHQALLKHKTVKNHLDYEKHCIQMLKHCQGFS